VRKHKWNSADKCESCGLERIHQKNKGVWTHSYQYQRNGEFVSFRAGKCESLEIQRGSRPWLEPMPLYPYPYAKGVRCSRCGKQFQDHIVVNPSHFACPGSRLTKFRANYRPVEVKLPIKQALKMTRDNVKRMLGK
jgi:DNA-directed RNA polymerase subunit RPC12/RpoP